MFSFWPPTRSPSGLSADREHRYTDTRRKGGRCFHPDCQKLPLQDPQCGLRLVPPCVGARRPVYQTLSVCGRVCVWLYIQQGVAGSLNGLLEEKTQRSASAEPVTFRACWNGRSPELEAVGVVADKDLGQWAKRPWCNTLPLSHSRSSALLPPPPLSVHV